LFAAAGSTAYEKSLYLTAETASLLYLIRHQTGAAGIGEVDADAIYQFIEDSVYAAISPTLPDAPSSNVVDTAAAVYSLVVGQLLADGAGIDRSSIDDGAAHLSAHQMGDGSWNGRALDTAWALKAMRAELEIVPSSIAYNGNSQTFTVNLRTVGPAVAENVRVSILTEDPTRLLPYQRAAVRLAASLSKNVAANATELFQVRLPAGGIPQAIYFMADAEETVPEYFEDNNVTRWTMPEKPNLVVYETGIRAVSANGQGPAVAGTPWTLGVDVWNMGRFPVSRESLVVQVYEGHPLLDSESRYLFWEGGGTGQILGGSKVTLTFTIAPSRLDLQTPGIHNLYVWVDPQSGMGTLKGEIEEGCETDNIAGARIRVYGTGGTGQPDLAIHADGVRYGPKPLAGDETGWLEVRVDNVDSGVAEDILLTVVRSNELGGERHVIPRLQGYHSTTLRLPLSLEATTTRTLTITVDPLDSIDETDEGNNEQQIVVVAYPPPAGLLDVGIWREDLSVSASRKAQGVVHNLGDEFGRTTAHSLAWKILYESGQGQDEETFNWSGLAMAPQATETLWGAVTIAGVTDFTLTYDLTQGGGVVGSIPEYTLANNIARRDFHLSPTNLRVVDFRMEPTVPTLENADSTTVKVTLTVTIANGDGTGPFQTMSGVHLRIYDDLSDEEYAYWNSLTLEPVRVVNDSVSNVITLTLDEVRLTAGVHNLAAVIDPIDFFVEPNEADNAKSIFVDVNDPYSRPNFDVSIASGDITFDDMQTSLRVRARVRHLGPGNAKAARNVRVRVLNEAKTQEISIPYHPTIIPILRPGEEATVLLPTSQLVSGLLDTVSVWVVIEPENSEDESNTSNNEASRTLARPLSPPTLSGAAVFKTIYINWTRPETVAGYRLVRYRMNGSVENLEQIWEFPYDRSSLTDTAASIQGNTTYRYRIWALAANGRAGAPASVDVRVGALPVITQVNGQGVAGAVSLLTLTSGNGLTVEGNCAMSADLKLVVNGAAVATLANRTGDSFTFSGVNLPTNRTRHSLRVLATKQVQGATVAEAYSNEVIVIVDNLPDLVFEKNALTNEPIITIATSNWGWLGAWRALEDVRDLTRLTGKQVAVSVTIRNASSINVNQPFDILYSFELADGTKQESLTRAASLGPGATQAFLSQMMLIPERAEIRKLRIKIDYLYQNGREVPYGRIPESSETNNTATILPYTYEDNYGNSFWIPIPPTVTAEHLYGYYSHWDELTPQPRVMVMPDPSLQSGAQQTVYFENYRRQNAYAWSNQGTPDWFPGCTSGPQVTLTPEVVQDWRVPGIETDPVPPFPSATQNPIWFYASVLQYDQSVDHHYVLDGCAVNVHSDRPFSAVYWLAATGAEGGSFLVLPEKHLGTTYVLTNFFSTHQEPTWFQVLAVKDGNTRVVIKPNFYGLPVYNDLWENGARYDPITNAMTGAVIGDWDPGRGEYVVNLKKGECYLRFIYRTDPTGVRIAASQPVAVLTGSYPDIPASEVHQANDFNVAMVPPLEHLGREYAVPIAPMSGTKPDYVNGFTRIVAPQDATVTVKRGGMILNTPNPLRAGDWLDVGMDLRTDGINPWLNDPVPNPTYKESSAYSYIVEASAPVLVYQYYASTLVTGPLGVRSPYNDKEWLPTLNHEFQHPDPGDPNMTQCTPGTAFTTDEHVPYATLQGFFTYDDVDIYGHYSPNPYDRNDWVYPYGDWATGVVQLPRQYVTVIVQAAPGVTPKIYVVDDNVRNHSFQFDIWDKAHNTPNRTTGWQPIGYDGRGIYYQYCTFMVANPYWARRLYYLYNPDRLPIAVTVSGLTSCDSFGHPMTYKVRSKADERHNWVDVEVSESGIRANTDEKVEIGKPNRFKVEILNNGDVPATYTYLRIDAQVGASWVNYLVLTPVPLEPPVAAKRMLPYIYTFPYTPPPGFKALRVRVSHVGDVDPTNDEATRVFQVSEMRWPNLRVKAMTFVPAAGPGNRAEVRYGEPVRVSATVTCDDQFVATAPVTVRIYDRGRPGVVQTFAGLVAQFNAAVSPSAVFQTTDTVVAFDWNVDHLAAYRIEVALDESGAIVESNESDNWRSFYYDVAQLHKGNLTVSNCSLTPASWSRVGEMVEVRATVTGDAFADYRNVPVWYGYGNPLSGPMGVLHEEVLAEVASSQVIQLPPVSLRMNELGNQVLYVAVNAAWTLPEGRYDDNVAAAAIAIIPEPLPDLTLAADSDFSVPLQAVRGETVALQALIANAGVSSATVPYKAVILDGSSEAPPATRLVEGILNTSGSQEPSSKTTLAGSWDTFEAAPGTHTLFLVIDPWQYLAATRGQAASASRTPLMAARLADAIGLSVADWPLAGTSWTLEVFATTDTVVAALERIGRFTPGRGFENATFSEATSRSIPWEAPNVAPLLLVLSSADGQPLPSYEGEWSFALTTANTTAPLQEAPVVIGLPANSAGRFDGREIAFWVADDGSVYFSRRYQLADDFLIEEPGGSSVTLTADQAMQNRSGLVAELNEANNVFARTIVIREETQPNLTVALRVASPDAPSSHVRVGELITVEATVTNVQADLLESADVRLRYRSVAPGPLTPVGESRTIVGGIAHGESKTVTFEWFPNTATGQYHLQAEADPSGAIAESNEGDNQCTTTLFLDGTTTVSFSAIDPLEYGPAAAVRTTLTVQSSESASASAQVGVYNSATNEAVEMLDLASSSPFPLQGSRSFALEWNTADFLAGTYYFQADVARLNDGREARAMVVASQPFTITASKVLAASIETDKAEYAVGENVWMTARAGNASVNWVAGELTVLTGIHNQYGQSLWSPPAQTIRNLARNREYEWAALWDQPDPLGTTFTAWVAVFEDANLNGVWNSGETTASAQTTFTYGSRKVTGTVDVVRQTSLQDVLYTSKTTVSVKVATLGAEASGNLMMLSDDPLAGPGVLTRNYVTDAGFELNLPLTENWRPAASGGLSVLETTTTAANVYAGGRALSAKGPSGGWFATKGGGAANEEGIRVPAGSYLAVSFWYKALSTSGALTLSVIERDSSATVLREISDPRLYGAQGAWDRGEFALVTRDDARSIGLRFTLAGAGDVRCVVDNLQIEIGRVATSWIDSSGCETNGRFLNLLANPSLTLDGNIPWSQMYPLLEPGNQIAGDKIPDGWQVSGNVTGQVITGATGPVLAERGLDDILQLTPSGATTITLRQSRIPVPPLKTMTFSVTTTGALAGQVVEMSVEQYDAQGALISGGALTVNRNIGAYWSRISHTFTTTQTARAIAVSFSTYTSSRFRCAAAQLEPGTGFVRWTGWAPYKNTIASWAIKSPATQGEKRAEGQFADSSGRLSQRPSLRLTLDPGATGMLQPGILNGTYTVKAVSQGSTVTLPGASLFDGDWLSAPAPAGAVRSTIVEIALPGARSLVSQVVLGFNGNVPGGSMFILEGAWDPGDWRTLNNSALAVSNGRFMLSDLSYQYAKYRITLSYPSETAQYLTEVDLRGWAPGFIDNVIYDATSPTATITTPLAGQIVGGSDQLLVVSASDAHSGIRSGRYRIRHGGGTYTAWADLSILAQGSGSATLSAHFDPRALTAGSATIEVKVTDRAGNNSTLATVDCQVDRTGPVLTEARFENLTTGNGEWVKASDQVLVSVRVDDATVTASQVFANLAAFGLSSAAPAGNYDGARFQWVLTGAIGSATDGATTVPIWALDPVGNGSTTVTAATTVDNTPPEITLAAPAGSPYLESSLTLVGQATDNATGRIAGAEYQVAGQGTWDGGMAADGVFDSVSEAVSFHLTGLVDDHYVVFARAIDAAGNVSATPAQVEFDVDVPPPTLSVSIGNLTTSGTAYVRDGDEVLIIAQHTGVDPASVAADASALGVPGGPMPPHIQDTTQSLWYLGPVVCTPANGPLAVTVSAYDSRNRPATGTATILADNTIPWSVLNPQTPDPVSTNSVVLTGTASDNAPDGRIASIEYSLDDTTWTLATLLIPPFGDAASEDFQIPLAGLADGAHTVLVRVLDLAGHLQTDHLSSDTFKVDTVPLRVLYASLERTSTDTVPMLVDTETSNTGYVRHNDDLALVANVSQRELEEGDVLTADLSGFSSSSAATAVVRYGWAVWTLPAVTCVPADGRIDVVITADDLAHAADVTTLTVVADNTSPTASIALWDRIRPVTPCRISAGSPKMRPGAGSPTFSTAWTAGCGNQRPPAIRWRRRAVSIRRRKASEC
jgi:hypothetical protein